MASAAPGERARKSRSKPKHQRLGESTHDPASSSTMRDTWGDSEHPGTTSNGRPDYSTPIDECDDEESSFQCSNRDCPLTTSASAPGPAAKNIANASAGFVTGEDFIPFDFVDDEDDQEEKELPPVTSPAKGKGVERLDRDTPNGLKRSAEVMEEEDTHSNKKQKTSGSSRLTPWAEDVNWVDCRNLAELLHQEVKAFVKYISPTPEEHDARSMVVTMISRVVKAEWSDAQVLPFGSYETKLYLPLGDIDLVIHSPSMEFVDKRRVLYRLAMILRKANITDNVQVIAKAKVPIIKFVTGPGRFAVDISLNQLNGVVAGRFVNRLLEELPALRSLVMVTKLFLSQRSMNEVYTGGLGSYAIVCMAVSFLQMHPKIRAGEINPSENLGVLVMEFFELYGHYFNYDNTGLSVRDGGTYFSKLSRGWIDPRRPFLLSIEDPLDISNDISKSSFNIPRVRKAMAGAHEVLTAVALTRSRVLIAKARGEYTDLRGRSRRSREDDHKSILGSVMGVTQETVSHRRMVKQLYEKSTLQNLLGLSPYRPPQPTAPRVSSGASNSLLRQQSRKAVESAWEEADMEIETDEDFPSRLRSSDVEESRYSTERPSKRQRISTPKRNGSRSNTVFVVASEDEQFVPQQKSAPYSRGSRDGSVQRRDPNHRNIEARRAYWASKGMSGGGLDGSD